MQVQNRVKNGKSLKVALEEAVPVSNEFFEKKRGEKDESTDFVLSILGSEASSNNNSSKWQTVGLCLFTLDHAYFLIFCLFIFCTSFYLAVMSRRYDRSLFQKNVPINSYYNYYLTTNNYYFLRSRSTIGLYFEVLLLLKYDSIAILYSIHTNT